MRKEINLTQKEFDALLGWLSADREEAGRRYERIRDGLIRFFDFRGCVMPDLLADDVINRAARQISQNEGFDEYRAFKFFHSYASNVYREYLKKLKNSDVPLDGRIISEVKTPAFQLEPQRNECECLENCLAKLPLTERKLVIEYYSKEKNEKLELRKMMAEALKLKPNALHAKIHRIKLALRTCIENCLDEN